MLLQSNTQKESVKLRAVYTGTTDTHCWGMEHGHLQNTPIQQETSFLMTGSGLGELLHINSRLCTLRIAELTHAPFSNLSPISLRLPHTCITFIHPQMP